MIYQIYMGSDTAGLQVQSANFIGEYTKFDDAYNVYKNCKDKCKKASSSKSYEYNRNYCYMIEINIDKRLYGYKNSEKIDNGCVSLTIMSYNYSNHPELHNMTSKEAELIKYNPKEKEK